MSKYNNMKSIPIDSIPEEEMAQAIKEWAEGDESMERLLWTCYKKGIKTSGCHAGGSPYIDFTDQKNINKISSLMDVTQKIEGSQILIKVDGGNPFSGAEWHLPNILLHLQTSYKDEADTFFDKLTNSLLQEDDSKNIHVLLRLLAFFKGKESALLFRLKHYENDKYRFTIETHEIGDKRYHEYDKIFTSAGMKEYKREDIRLKLMRRWKVEGESLEDIISKMNSIADYIVKNYSLEPSELDEVVSFQQLSRYKMQMLPEDEFNEWLDNEKKKAKGK